MCCVQESGLLMCTAFPSTDTRPCVSSPSSISSKAQWVPIKCQGNYVQVSPHPFPKTHQKDKTEVSNLGN